MMKMQVIYLPLKYPCTFILGKHLNLCNLCAGFVFSYLVVPSSYESVQASLLPAMTVCPAEYEDAYKEEELRRHGIGSQEV